MRTTSEPFQLEGADEINSLNYVFQNVAKSIRPGIRTRAIDDFAEELIANTESHGYFKGFKDFPATTTISVNDEIIHTPPSNRVLRKGDLVSIQTGVERNGRFAFVGWTFPVGEVSEERRKLLEVGPAALEAAIELVRDGLPISKLTQSMDSTIRSSGYSPNREFIGYQIGPEATMAPAIPCALSAVTSAEYLEVGMTICLVVIYHEGSYRCVVAPDNHSVLTMDGSDSALFTCMVRVEKDRGILLTSFSWDQ